MAVANWHLHSSPTSGVYNLHSCPTSFTPTLRPPHPETYAPYGSYLRSWSYFLMLAATDRLVVGKVINNNEEGFRMGINERKKAVNRLVMDEAINDDDSAFAMNCGTMKMIKVLLCYRILLKNSSRFSSHPCNARTDRWIGAS